MPDLNIHLYHHLVFSPDPLLASTLEQVKQLLTQQSQFLNQEQKEVKVMFNSIQEAVDGLTQKVNAVKTVDDSVIVAFKGIPALIAAAVANAQSNGATPAQLQAFTDLGTALDAKSAELAAAVTANTGTGSGSGDNGGAPPPPPPPPNPQG